MRKFLSVFLLLALLTLAVVGCSGGDDTDNADNNGSNTNNLPSNENPDTNNEPETEPEDNDEQPPQNEELSDSYTYTMVASVSDGTEMEVSLWCKGDKYLMEWSTNIPGAEVVEAKWILKDGFVYMYMPVMNMAIKYSSEETAGFDAVFEEAFTGYYTIYGTDAEILAGFEEGCTAANGCEGVAIIGHETISGEDCTIFEVTLVGGDTEKIWVAKNQGYPLKVEATAGGIMTTIEFSEIDLNAQIADSVFDLPEGVQITTMG